MRKKWINDIYNMHVYMYTGYGDQNQYQLLKRQEPSYKINLQVPRQILLTTILIMKFVRFQNQLIECTEMVEPNISKHNECQPKS